MLKQVPVWYDYSTLPQSRGPPDDEEFLNRAPNRLPEIVSGSEVVALWGIESLNRAWCVFEALAADAVHFCSPAYGNRLDLTEEALARASMRDESGEADEWFAYVSEAGPRRNIAIAVDQMRSDLTGLHEGGIRGYLVRRDIRCTESSDLDRLATLIHRHLAKGRGVAG